MAVLLTQVAQGDSLEFAVEISNDGAAPVDIGGYTIVSPRLDYETNQMVDQVLYTFPPGTIVPAEGAISVANSNASFAAHADLTDPGLSWNGWDKLEFRDAGNGAINAFNDGQPSSAMYNTNAEFGPGGWTSSYYGSGTPTGLDLACFLAGTMIRTNVGEIAVEDLAIGQLVATADGRSLPVRFVGRQTVAARFADPLATAPVCIRAGALAENVPSRDLHTSAGHAMLVDGVLAVAGALVNGSTIVRTKPTTAQITYYHVELGEHAVIFANDAPAESFVDNVSRNVFDNRDEYAALYPNPAPIVAMELPLIKSMRQLPRQVKQRLARRAAALMSKACDKAA